MAIITKLFGYHQYYLKHREDMQNTRNLNSNNKLTVQEDDEGMRLDNYLIKILKGIPKSRIYRMIRKGEVRRNSKRSQPKDRIFADDKIRIPPNIYKKQKTISFKGNDLNWIKDVIIFENNSFLVVNKPSGLAVHGGSGINFGLIELLRSFRDDLKENLELVHRLDRATSGCLLISKQKSKLRKLHEFFREGTIKKTYIGLMIGTFNQEYYKIDQPLKVSTTVEKGRLSVPDHQGKQAKTKFTLLERYSNASLFKIEPITGKTHQIRAHAKYMKTPLAGDNRYGIQPDPIVSEFGLNRLFLHSETIQFPGLTNNEENYCFKSELDPKLIHLLNKLRSMTQ